MKTKLTLTLEKHVIEEARKYAREKGQSLSNLVENYFKMLTREKIQIPRKELSPQTRKLRGVLKVEKEFDYKKVLAEELSKKYEA